jgi:hypothetical protein
MMTRRLSAVVAAGVLSTLALGAQAPPKQAGGEPKVTWYFYTAVRTYVPEFHGDGRADWTFAVELVVPPGAPATPTDGEIIAKLYPDRATFAKEEQRRFEILAAHWDVPLNRLNLDTRKPAR